MTQRYLTGLLALAVAWLAWGCNGSDEPTEYVFGDPARSGPVVIDDSDTPKVHRGEAAEFKEGNWMSTGSGLAARVTFDKKSYRKGEPIVANLEVRNETTRAFYIPKSLLYYVPIWELKHVNEDRPRAFAPNPREPRKRSHYVLLEPFKTYRFPADNTLLRLTERIDKPGRYVFSIGGVYNKAVSGQPVWTGRFASPEASFEVVP